MTAESTPKPLTGKLALVTGAAKRLGKAIAIALADDGADVVVHYRTSKKEALETVAAIEKRGVYATAFKTDLTDPRQVGRLFTGIGKLGRGLHILVNNIGILDLKDIRALTLDEWQRGLDGTVNAAYYCCREALPLMREQRYGRIINIADAMADRIEAFRNATSYHIGKTGILILTKTLAAAEGKDITVNAVSPGVIHDSFTLPPAGEVPAGRWASYDDITHAVRFLVDEKSSYINGANIKVTGGWNS
ncbi:MAG: SDR family NAD(P)-dependent oxidoreductase [Gammaproteobacteria bacterium]